MCYYTTYVRFSFNRQLVDGRDKPIIMALEFIREYLMKRIAKKKRRKSAQKFIEPMVKRLKLRRQ